MQCQDINECLSNPCNQGECEDRVNGFYCRCSSGYTGEYCDQGEAIIIYEFFSYCGWHNKNNKNNNIIIMSHRHPDEIKNDASHLLILVSVSLGIVILLLLIVIQYLLIKHKTSLCRNLADKKEGKRNSHHVKKKQIEPKSIADEQKKLQTHDVNKLQIEPSKNNAIKGLEF
ncbi:hypothetical protein KUTeg_009931 [Tegillarca granosa]|uniref:EGF-like domain-containing protein n=1 Tax=Tegillarca granosa TaxID=220873 RepID=A0ABQ9F596_TEGGR|nr:hypothetical protein KUTeg_009931 [Tegillarca granosa]